MQNNFEHLYCLNILNISWAHKTLRLTFKVAFPGVRLKSFTLDNESEVYFKNFHSKNLLYCINVLQLPRDLRDAGFYLGFFVWGGSRSWKKFWATRRGEKIFLGLLGGPEACSPGKFWKYSVQDWLRSHFWTLVTFTDSLKSSSKKIFIWNSCKFFCQ